jgi:hypothetical protein
MPFTERPRECAHRVQYLHWGGNHKFLMLFVSVSRATQTIHSQCCWKSRLLQCLTFEQEPYCASTQCHHLHSSHLVKIRDYCNAISRLIFNITVSRRRDFITFTDSCYSGPALQNVNETCSDPVHSNTVLLWHRNFVILWRFGIPQNWNSWQLWFIQDSKLPEWPSHNEWSLLGQSASQHGVRIRRAGGRRDRTLYLHALRYKYNMWGPHINPLTLEIISETSDTYRTLAGRPKKLHWIYEFFKTSSATQFSDHSSDMFHTGDSKSKGFIYSPIFKQNKAMKVLQVMILKSYSFMPGRLNVTITNSKIKLKTVTVQNGDCTYTYQVRCMYSAKWRLYIHLTWYDHQNICLSS